jgi:hypothetical protein
MPPLIDSMTYLLSFEETWGTVSPARAPISSKTGIGGNAGLEDAELERDPVAAREGWLAFRDCPQTGTNNADEITRQKAHVRTGSIEEL